MANSLLAVPKLSSVLCHVPILPATHNHFHHHLSTSVQMHMCAFASGAAIGDAATIADTKKQLVALLDAAEAQLSKTAFLAGDTYSAADVMLTCAVFLVEQAKQAKLELAPRPNLSKWWKGIKQRPSYKAVFGPATSPVTLLTMVLPAVSKVMVKKLLHQYWLELDGTVRAAISVLTKVWRSCDGRSGHIFPSMRKKKEGIWCLRNVLMVAYVEGCHSALSWQYCNGEWLLFAYCFMGIYPLLLVSGFYTTLHNSLFFGSAVGLRIIRTYWLICCVKMVLHCAENSVRAVTSVACSWPVVCAMHWLSGTAGRMGQKQSCRELVTGLQHLFLFCKFQVFLALSLQWYPILWDSICITLWCSCCPDATALTYIRVLDYSEKYVWKLRAALQWQIVFLSLPHSINSTCLSFIMRA